MNAPIHTAEIASKEASTLRVAMGWFKRLLQRAPATPRKDEELVLPATLSKNERRRVLDKEYKALKHEFWHDQASEIPGLRRAEAQIAKKHGIDPLYLNWFVVQGSNWPALPPKTRKALRTIQDIYFWHAALPSEWRGMETPTDLRAADRALKELGEYFLRVTLKSLLAKWKRVLQGRAKKLTQLYKKPGQETDAAVELWRDFRSRLIADRFQGRGALLQTVYLMA